MGYKTLKEHYRLSHIVSVHNNAIQIGSPYLSGLIVVGMDGTIIIGYKGKNPELSRFMAEATANPEKLREVIQASDTFEKSIPVYTYDGGNIIEKQCEEIGYPNVTHNGTLMYDFSTNKAEIIQRAKDRARRGVQSTQKNLDDLRQAIAETEASQKKFQADLAQLEAEWPEQTGQVTQPPLPALVSLALA